MLNNFRTSWIASSFITTSIIVFLSAWIQKEGLLYFPHGTRQIIILFFFIINWILFGKKIVLQRNYKVGIALMLLFLAMAYPFSPAKLLNYVLGTASTFLFLVLFIFGLNTKTNISVIVKIFKGMLVFFFLTSISPLISGIFHLENLRYVPTLYRELGAYGAAMNIGTIIGISLFIITSKKKYLYLSIFFSFAVIMTILKKSIIGNLIVWLVFYIYFNSPKKKVKFILYLIMFLVIGYFEIGKPLSNNINENVNYLENVGDAGHVRIGMYIASFSIARDYFPFGSGMGTFGSVASIIGGYSRIYIDYGVSKLGSNSPADVAAGHVTLFDTYWPHIFGELGALGTILFLYLWFYPLRKAIPILRSANDPLIRGLSFFIILIIITMSWAGFTLYTPEIPAFIFFHSGLTGLCYFHIKYYTPESKSLVNLKSLKV